MFFIGSYSNSLTKDTTPLLFLRQEVVFSNNVQIYDEQNIWVYLSKHDGSDSNGFFFNGIFIDRQSEIIKQQIIDLKSE